MPDEEFAAMFRTEYYIEPGRPAADGAPAGRSGAPD